MRAWFIIFCVSSLIALIALVIPIGGLGYLATIFANGSLLAMLITGAGQNGNA
jgi:hypothetical protein